VSRDRKTVRRRDVRMSAPTFSDQKLFTGWDSERVKTVSPSVQSQALLGLCAKVYTETENSSNVRTRQKVNELISRFVRHRVLCLRLLRGAHSAYLLAKCLRGAMSG